MLSGKETLPAYFVHLSVLLRAWWLFVSVNELVKATVRNSPSFFVSRGGPESRTAALQQTPQGAYDWLRNMTGEGTKSVCVYAVEKPNLTDFALTRGC